ncbi:hypothetical protein D3C71_1826410 [compost metagenome]
MVLDDAVVHQRHAVADVGVRIGLGHATVGGPAGVADPEQRLEAFARGGLLHLGHAAGTAHTTDVSFGGGGIDHGNARGVVAPVFQSLQAFDEYRYHVAMGDRSHNAAHRFRSLLVSLAF